MRSKEEIIKRLGNIRDYHEAGWFEDHSHAAFAASELLWALGYEEGSGVAFLDGASIWSEEEGRYVYL